MSSPDQVARWLESPEGEKWSRNHHYPAHAGESHLPNHIASVGSTPGRDWFWDLRMGAARFNGRALDPEHDPSGRLPMTRTRGRSQR